MLAGSALHAFLETCSGTGEISRAESEGYAFHFLCDAPLPLVPLRELAGTKTYRIDGEDVTVTARVDGGDGTGLLEHKLTHQFDAERYHDSIQWRCYLDIFGAQQITYNIFVGKEASEIAPDESLCVWDIREFHPITFYAYPEMESDIRDELALYVEFARTHLKGK